MVSSVTKPDAGQADGWTWGNSKLVISEYMSSGSDSFHIVSDAGVSGNSWPSRGENAINHVVSAPRVMVNREPRFVR